ncbi:MAG TPA: DUF4340 domain-containing protein [Thermoanaerobaculia bacterium]
MSPRKLLVLTAVVLLLFGFILLFERKMPTTADRERKGDLVWDLPESRIETVRLENGPSLIELQRTNGSWRLVKPEAYPADSASASDLVSQLASLKRAGAEPPEGKAEDYGLNNASPKATVVWKDESNEKRKLSRTLTIGRDLPGTDATAARAGDDLLCFIPSSVASAVRKSADDFKSKDLFTASAFDAARLEIERGRGRLYLAKKNGSWWINQPITDLADGDAVQRLVSDLTGLKAIGFLTPAERQDLASLGLAPPLYRVTLADAKATSTTVDFGATRSDGNSIYARNEGQVLKVPSTITEELSKEAVAFRDAHLMRFERPAATSLTGTFGGKSFAIDKSSGSWTAGGQKLQDSAVEDLLSALLDAKSRSFVDNIAPLKNKTAAASISVKAPAGDWNVSFYPMHPDSQATVNGRPGAFAVSDETISSLQSAFQKAAAAIAPTPAPTAPPTRAAPKK